MPRSPFFVVALALLAGACNDPPEIELPHDAARPAAAPQSAPTAAPAPTEAPPQPSATRPRSAPPGMQPSPRAKLPDGVERAPRDYVQKTANPQLTDRTLAHRVYRSSLGPSHDTGQPTAVVLTRDKGKVARLGGFALSGETRYEFPPLHDGDALDRVAAVVFHDVDDDPDREIVLLISYKDEDPQAASYFSNVVLDWDVPGGRFVRLSAVEGEIEAYRTAGEVLAHLEQLTPP